MSEKTATKRSRAAGPGRGSERPEKKAQCLLDKVLVGEGMLPLTTDPRTAGPYGEARQSTQNHSYYAWLREARR